MKCPIKDINKNASRFFDDFIKTEGWDKKVDRLFDGVSDTIFEVGKKIDEKSPWLGRKLSIQRHGREINEIFDDFNRARSMIYAQAAKVKEYLGKLSTDDSHALFRALDGELNPAELKEHIRPLYSKFRGIIDSNAKALVEAGALKEENLIKDYIKRYYKEALENNLVSMKITHDKLHKRKDLSYDERLALNMLEDADFAVANTLAEQRNQLLKAGVLKQFADKFGRDEAFLGSVRISDETVGGGVYKYGALAGKYVPEDVARAIKEAEIIKEEMDIFNNGYFKFIDHIKVNVTVKNPFTHIYNIGSNVLLSYLHGDIKTLKDILALRISDKEAFGRLVDQANELGLSSQLNDFEKQIALKGDKNDGIVMTIFKNAYLAEGSKLGSAARTAYDWEDKIFKLARFKKNLDAGMDKVAAMKDAQWGYVDYGTHFNGTLRMLDKSGIMPFLHYSVKSTPMVLKTIMKHPVRFMALQAALVGLGASSWMGDNEKENLAKPEWAESGAVPNMFGVKSWVKIAPGWYLNSGRIVPGFRFDGFDKFEFSGGFVRGMLNIAGGKSSLGYSNESEDDSMLERLAKRSKEFVKSYFPPMTFGRYGMNMGDKLLSNAAPKIFEAPKDYNQDELGYGEILARGVGVREFNEKKEYKKEINKAKREYQKAQKEGDSVAAKKAERKFDLYKNTAKSAGFELDIELLKREKESGFGSGSAFKPLKFGF